MAHGGARKGAGRPKGKGRFNEPTKPMRVPLSMVGLIQDFAEGDGPDMGLPLYSSRVQAGYPSAADDHIETRIDLTRHLVKQPSSTFLVRASGDSMIDAGIRDGDLLIVDRNAKAVNGKVVVAAIDGELTVKFLIEKKGTAVLMPANPKFLPIPINSESGVHIWGVVTSSVHEH
ncbi:MAG: translesion error-prone DNA polymerase V autoproteolytic subunit [Pseudomonadota bacterium]